MAIIISRHGQDATKLEHSGIVDEDYLQGYIARNPDSLPLDELADGTRLLVLGREFPTSSGPIDVLAIDRDGWLYLIETKLYKNPDKRMVVAQILDYGAALWRGYPAPEQFIADIDDFLGAQAGSLAQRLRDFYGLGPEEAQTTIDSLKQRVAEGSLRFLVLMDRLHQNLRDLILFLNQNSRFSIYAVEMEFYRHGDLEIVIPKLYGSEVRKVPTVTGAASRKRWDESSFFEDATRRLDAGQLAAVRKIYELSCQLADEVPFGTGAITGSFSPKYHHASNKSYYTVRSDGVLVLNFGWHPDGARESAFRDGLKQHLEKLAICHIPAEYATQYLNVPPESWTPRVDGLLEAIRSVFRKH